MPFLLGLLTGALLFGGITAVAAGVAAEPSKHAIYVDGRQVPMAAYRIAGNNYVKLRDIGKALDVNVYWQNGVTVQPPTPAIRPRSWMTCRFPVRPLPPGRRI